jgi:hypothetical protein
MIFRALSEVEGHYKTVVSASLNDRFQLHLDLVSTTLNYRLEAKFSHRLENLRALGVAEGHSPYFNLFL